MKRKSRISDADLVRDYQRGNKQVLPALVKRWHVQFCKLAFFYVKDKDVAKDIAQESWMVIFNKLHEVQDPEKSKSWAMSVVHRKALDWLRKETRERTKLQSFFLDETRLKEIDERKNEFEKVKIDLLSAIRELSINQQEVVQLFYKEGYTLKEISEIMKTKVSITKSRLFHAREKLKTIVKNTNYEK